MSAINGLGAPLGPLSRPLEPAGAERERETTSTRDALAPTQTQRARPEQAAATATAAVPGGVDPALWSMLTTEERSHFAKLGKAGGLTYGPAPKQQPAQALARGLRLDVRV